MRIGTTSCGPAIVAISASTFVVPIVKSRRLGHEIADLGQERLVLGRSRSACRRVRSCQASISACRRSRLASSAALRGAKSSSSAANPRQNGTASMPSGETTSRSMNSAKRRIDLQLRPLNIFRHARLALLRRLRTSRRNGYLKRVSWGERARLWRKARAVATGTDCEAKGDRCIRLLRRRPIGLAPPRPPTTCAVHRRRLIPAGRSTPASGYVSEAGLPDSSGRRDDQGIIQHGRGAVSGAPPQPPGAPRARAGTAGAAGAAQSVMPINRKEVGSFCCPVRPEPLESLLLPGGPDRVLTL